MRTTDIQMGREIERLIARCLVRLKIKGASPNKFIKSRVTSRDAKIEKEAPIFLASVRDTNSSTILRTLLINEIKADLFTDTNCTRETIEIIIAAHMM